MQYQQTHSQSSSLPTGAWLEQTKHGSTFFDRYMEPIDIKMRLRNKLRSLQNVINENGIIPGIHKILFPAGCFILCNVDLSCYYRFCVAFKPNPDTTTPWC